MRLLFVIEFIAFYLFFFLRAILLSIKVRKNIKSNNPVLNLAVLSAGLSALLFVSSMYYRNINRFLFPLFPNPVLFTGGFLLVTLGLIFSVVASIHLGNSWRIGVDTSEKTELVTSGIYRFSRNPYFASYDFVLVGTILASSTILVSVFSLLTIVLFHMLILREEKYLESIHGDDYSAYKKRVRRYL